MAATGFTPISLYYTTTASAAPTAGNLVAGELAINTNDGVIYYKDSSGVVQSIASKATNSGSFTNLAYTGTLTGGTGVVNLGSGQFYKDASGNIGVGTASPNSAGVNKALTISGTANSILELNYGSTRAGYLYANSAATILSAVPAASILQFNTVDTERMRIDSSGNVGIGTSSPGVASGLGLVLNGAAGQTRLAFKNTTSGDASTDGFQIGIDSAAEAFIEQRENLPLRFSTNATEAMRIDSSGNLLVGATAPLLAAKVYVAINPLVNAGLVFYPTSNNTYDAIRFANNAGSQVGSIAVSSTATSYITSSDYRLKENVAPMTDALDTVAKLKPVTYTWKSTGEDGQGFIAHELAEVCPEAVIGEKDAVNKDGSIKAQGIDTSFLVATLTAAIQEQQAMIETLTTRLNALEGK